VKLTRAWLIDAAERIAATFVEAFMAIIIAAGTTSVNMSTVKAAAVAGFTAVLSFVKTLAASRVSDPQSASLAPGVPPPSPPPSG
jgi:hypothetical protein